MRNLSLLIALVLATSSCAEPFAPPRALVSAQLVDHSSGQPGQLTVTVDVRVENTTNAPIYFSSCSSSLQREDTRGSWEPFGGVACLLILPAHPLDGMVMVPAGDFREMRAQLSAFGKVGVDFMAAPYRISLTVAVPTESPVARGFGSAITTQVLTSNEFTLSP